MKPIDAPIRRSVLITPASRPERILRAARTPCDSVVIDLEDGVPAAAKSQARAHAVQALAGVDFGGRERAVRINAPGTAELAADLHALDLARLDAIWVPKVECAQQVLDLAAVLSRPLPLILSIETPAGLFAAEAIAAVGAAVDVRSALFFGSGDYCMETGARPGGAGLAVPRALIVAAAAAHRLQAIDAAYFLDPRDADATGADARIAREFGFDGKLVFHPDQIASTNEVFTPLPAEVHRARRLIHAFEAARDRGEGTLIVDGSFLAVDTVQPLRRVLWMADQLGLRLIEDADATSDDVTETSP